MSASRRSPLPSPFDHLSGCVSDRIQPRPRRWGRRQWIAAALLAGLLPAAAAQEGVTAASITLGQSLPLTGPAALLAKPFHLGAKLYFDRVNASGGVGGRRIDLVTLDDQGRSEQTVANTQKLLAQGVLALFGFYGSPQVTAAYPLARDSDTLMFAPMAAADEFRGAMYGNVFVLRPGYSEEAAAITRHAEALGARRLAILHAQDSESMAALESAQRTMSGVGANLVGNVALVAGKLPEGIGRALTGRPESVLVIGEPGLAGAAVRELRTRNFRGPIYGFSNTGESLLAEQIGATGAGVVVARVVPKSDSPKVPLVRELAADAQAAGVGRPNVYMLEGYLAARVFTEALRRIPRDPNRVKLRKALESIDDFSVGGFRVHFTEDRVASRIVELGLIDSQGRVRE